MERVPHAETLRGRLAGASATERRSWCERLVEYVARLHAAGWYHRDLYLQHFVLAEQAQELALLDVGRARRETSPRTRWFVKDLGARRADIWETTVESGLAEVRGFVPLSEMFGYSTSVRSLSQGRGSFSLEPFDYGIVPDAIAERDHTPY